MEPAIVQQPKMFKLEFSGKHFFFKFRLNKLCVRVIEY